MDLATARFVTYRNLLSTVAYEMLGSAADAEDVLQEAWLRWVKVEPSQVRDDRAFLVRITTRLSLDRLRAMKRRKESYIGPWLPEPLLTAPDVAEDVELAAAVEKSPAAVRQIAHRARRHVEARRPRAATSSSQVRAAAESFRRAHRRQLLRPQPGEADPHGHDDTAQPALTRVSCGPVILMGRSGCQA